MSAVVATYVLWLFMTIFMLSIVILGGTDKRFRSARSRESSRRYDRA
ncbi:MAG: hypothetical protein ACE14L_10965 [Terriglobales bacterium]